MTSLDTTIHGDPRSVADAADKCTAAVSALGDVIGLTGNAEKRASSWQGLGGARFETAVADQKTDLRHVESRLKTMASGLNDFSAALTSLQSTMISIREDARAGGLTVSGTSIVQPGETGPGADAAAVTANNKLIETWNKVVPRVDGVREREQQAHDALGDIIKQTTGDGWVETLLQKLGLAPGDTDPVDLAGYVLGLGGTGLGIASLLGTKVYGSKFHLGPLYGDDGELRSSTALERFKGYFSKNNWDTFAGKSALKDGWETAGKLGTRAGWVVTAGVSFYDQWHKDADDPSLSTTERAGRATSTAAITTAGAAAGAWAGGEVGAAIGTAVFPGVGTVVGGAVGGLIGGAVGSGLAGKVADWAADGAGEFTDWAAHHAGEAAAEVGDAADAAKDATVDAIGSAAHKAGDVASDVGDALTFWN